MAANEINIWLLVSHKLCSCIMLVNGSRVLVVGMDCCVVSYWIS